MAKDDAPDAVQVKVKKAKPGRTSLFRNKVREPVTLTLTKNHHTKIKKAVVRTGLTRADVIGLLIEKYADSLTADDVNLIKP